MKIKELESALNSDSFKSKVKELFSKEISEKIDFDFKIVISRFAGELIKVSVQDNSYDLDGTPIPKLFAIVPSNSKRINKEIIKQFKEVVSIFEQGYYSE